MRHNGEQARDGGDLQHEVQVENVEDHRADRHFGLISISVSHTDLSSVISIGPWEIPGSPERILQALEKNVPTLLRAMEARVPEARRAALSPDDFWRSLFESGLVIEVLVPDRGER